MQMQRKKRRPAPGPSKNEMRAARGEREEKQRTQAGTLRQRFPRAGRVELGWRLEASSGAVLDQILRLIGPDEPLTLNVPCPGGCGGGVFLLTDTVERLLEAGAESREGMALCQAASYADPRTPCGTKLYYRITITYAGPAGAEASPT